jgi:pimeloyl-ACP methyl ester carboxylesterase
LVWNDKEMARVTTHSTTKSGITLDNSGNGEILVVLVHGTLDRSAGMARVAREIPEGVRVQRYDRRGYARSTALGGPFTVDQHIADLVEIVGQQPAILIGHSFGGNVALGAAQQLGKQILGVSTYETPLSWMPWWSGQSAGSRAVASGSENAAEEFMIRLIGQRRWDALPEKTKTDRRAEGPTLVGELSSLRLGAPWTPEHIHCPVIAGIGTKAADHHKRGADWIAEHVPHGTLAVFEGAGHGAPVSHAPQFFKMLVAPHLQRLASI